METEEDQGAPRGLLLSLGIIGLLVAAGIAGIFVLRLQPQLSTGTAASGSVIMPSGVGSNTAVNFSPAVVTLIIGQNNTVTFVNKDSATHTVTATDKSFDSGDIKAGGSWTHTFSAPGTYTYYCIYHSWMKATVVVKSSSGGAPGGLTVNIPAGAGSDTSKSYVPRAMKLVVGVNNTVTFANQDSVTHTVTSNDGSFDSGDIKAGGSWTHTFGPGTYSFHCVYHSYMTGTITVVSG